MWISDIPEDGYAVFEQVLEKYTTPEVVNLVQVDPQNGLMTHHPHVVINFDGSREDRAALADLEANWSEVTALVKACRGKGLELLSSNGRARKTLAWYKRMGFVSLNERVHREHFARRVGLNPETLLLGPEEDPKWQDKLRNYWTVSKVLSDTCPMFLPLKKMKNADA